MPIVEMAVENFKAGYADVCFQLIFNGNSKQDSAILAVQVYAEILDSHSKDMADQFIIALEDLSI